MFLHMCEIVTIVTASERGRVMADIQIFSNPSKNLHLNNVPDEILFEIFKKLDFEDLCRCSAVCRRWFELAHSFTLRKKIVVGRYLKPVHFSQLVQHHFHKQLEEFQFLNDTQRPRLCVVKKMTFYNLSVTCPELKKLVLTCCSMKYISLEDMPVTLQYLSLRKSELNPYHFFKVSPQQYAPHLTCLDLGGVVTFLTSEDLHIFTRLKSLRCLYLEHCFRINDGGIESMIDLIRHLEVLDVEGTDITNEGAQIIITNGVMLKKLYIGFAPINDYVFDGIYMNMFLRLENLCVRFTNISVNIIKKLQKNNGIKIEFSINGDPHFSNLEDIGLVAYRSCNHYLSHSCSL